MANNIFPIADADLAVNNDGSVNTLVPKSEQLIKNRLGYKVNIKDEQGRWLDEIIMVDDQGRTDYARGLAEVVSTQNEQLNAILDSFIVRSFTLYVPRALNLHLVGIRAFTEEFKSNDGKIEDALENALTRMALEDKDNPGSGVAAIRKLITYLVAHEYPSLSVDRAAELAGVKIGSRQNSYQRLFLMDDTSGPFTREEMGILNSVLENDTLDIPLDTRIIVQLCVDFGLRPIQMGLLKQCDFYHNPQNGVYWLNVPRVKQETRDRRVEFKRRLLSSRLGLLIDQMIEDDRWMISIFDQKDPPLFQRHVARYFKFDDESDTIIVSNKTRLSCVLHPYEELYGDDKRDYSFHLQSTSIDWRIKRLEAYLPLSPRTGLPFQLNAYRFRYTLGTASVIQGMTAPEVADLLDHSNSDSVKHYFKNTQEYWELIEHATTARIEQKHFVAKFLTKEPEEENIYVVDVTERTMFTTIGKCYKGSPCHLEPAVACYGCSTFCPNNNTEGHERAKAVILDMAERSAQQSSEGHIRHAFDDALVGVEAAIAKSKGKATVLGIHDSSPEEARLAMEVDNEQ